MALRPLLNYKKQREEADALENDNEEVANGIIETEKEEKESPVSAEQAVENFKQEFAGKLGWTDKSEWEKRGLNLDNWHDYDHFLNSHPAYTEKLRKITKEQKHRLERSAAAAAATIEDERRQARADAEREAREAAAAGDADRAAAAVAKAADAGPPAETVAWINRNPWFNEDAEARALASAVVERSARAGATVAEQLQAGENAVKKRFPEYFDQDDDIDLPSFITKQPKAEPKQEIRLSESTRVANIGNGNSGARTREVSKSREKSFGDIPQGDRDLYEQYFAKKLQGRYKSVDEARTAYAKRYWSEKGS